MVKGADGQVAPKEVSIKPGVSEAEVQRSLDAMESPLPRGEDAGDTVVGPTQVNITDDSYTLTEIDTSNTEFLPQRMQHIKKDLLTNKSASISLLVNDIPPSPLFQTLPDPAPTLNIMLPLL